VKSLLEIVNCVSSGLRPLKCEGCGNEFNCGASLAGCWCSEIKLSAEARAEFGARYRDCLCRECLKSIEKPETANRKP